LILGIGAALARELLDRTVKAPEDIERDLGLTFLGLLPQVLDGPFDPAYGQRKGRRRAAHTAETLGKPEFVVHAHPSSGLAEAARAIRTNILFMAPDRPYRTLLVTSAAPADGKTMIACWMATAMAQAGQRVVLVDCDMRRPRLHKIFDARGHTGITTAMLDMGELDGALLKTPIPNLTVLPCGPVPPNPAELLHSEAFNNVLEELGRRFDRVVIDSPPLAPVTDAAVLSARVDGTLLVIRALKTTKDVARRATRSLRDVGANVVGAVLNAVDAKQRDYGYYYQYYYYRSPSGSADSDDPTSTDKRSAHETSASPPN
jgi:capsular exopolysaccharide synthesis family protein